MERFIKFLLLAILFLFGNLSAQSFNASEIPSMSNTYFRDNRFIFFVETGFAPLKAGVGLGANINKNAEIYIQLNQFFIPTITYYQTVGLGGKYFFGYENSWYGIMDLAGAYTGDGKGRWGVLTEIGLGNVTAQIGILNIRTQLRLITFINSYKAPEYYPGLDISFCFIEVD